MNGSQEKLEEKRRNDAVEGFVKSIEKVGVEANPDCKKCYGRGYTGRDVNTNLMKPCRCIRRRKDETR